MASRNKLRGKKPVLNYNTLNMSPQNNHTIPGLNKPKEKPGKPHHNQTPPLVVSTISVLGDRVPVIREPE